MGRLVWSIPRSTLRDGCLGQIQEAFFLRSTLIMRGLRMEVIAQFVHRGYPVRRRISPLSSIASGRGKLHLYGAMRHIRHQENQLPRRKVAITHAVAIFVASISDMTLHVYC